MPQSIISERLRFHIVSHKVKGFIARGLLDEFHLREIIKLSPGDNLSLWLTNQQAWKELAEKAVHDRAKNGNKSREKTRNDQILDLYLEGYTQAEIGRRYKLSQKRVLDLVNDIRKGIDAKIAIPDPPQVGDVWFFTSCDNQYGLAGYPGRWHGAPILPTFCRHFADKLFSTQ